ncbi:MAG: hypothetical protein ACUVRJ_11325, partial [Candidatus Villigracilaceae bacterium]
MPRQVIYDIFPDRRRPQHRHALGKAQRFANQATIHGARGQVSAFNVSSMWFQFSQDLLRLTKDHTQFHIDNAPIFALFDHL